MMRYRLPGMATAGQPMLFAPLKGLSIHQPYPTKKHNARYHKTLKGLSIHQPDSTQFFQKLNSLTLKDAVYSPTQTDKRTQCSVSENPVGALYCQTISLNCTSSPFALKGLSINQSDLSRQLAALIPVSLKRLFINVVSLRFQMP